MQKLTMHTLIKNDRGSALITAVVFVLLMAIAGLGFVWLTVNSLNKDTDAYINDKAFHAAESGALIVSKYLMSRTPACWTAALPAELASDTINNLYVRVSLVTPVNGDATKVEVRATAYASGTDSTTFKKRVVITLQ